MVSAMGVMLHMAHVWARERGFETKLNYADAASDGALAACIVAEHQSELVL